MQEDINQLTHRIIGCAMTVHNIIGNGFQEVIYQRALSIELNMNDIPHQRELEMPIFYREQQIGTRRADFVIAGEVILEIKAVEAIKNEHKNQTINYLEAYGMANGLLINFGGSSLEFKRMYNRKMRQPYEQELNGR